MTADYQRQLERNIGKFSWFKIFTKRVYLPLIAIQLVNNGGVTVAQLAFIAVVVSIVTIVMQLPTGYIADKWGNEGAVVFGSGVAALSPLAYIIMPNFTGGMVGGLLFFCGYAFVSGAIEAFMHDTLVELGREKQYAKVMGRAQSYGLIGNIVLIIAVPATYSINHALPFILGFISLAINFFIALSFTYPKRVETAPQKKNPVAAIRSIVNRYNIAVFVFAGVLFGVTHRSGEYRELVFQSVGIPVTYFGVLIAVASLLGAAYGLCLHVLDRMKPTNFFLLDLAYIAGCLILVGLSRNPYLIATGFILFMAYDRVRGILIQSRLLQTVQHGYKATLISALNLFALGGEILAVSALSGFINLRGYIDGYLLFGLVTLFVGLVLWLPVYWSVRKLKIET